MNQNRRSLKIRNFVKIKLVKYKGIEIYQKPKFWKFIPFLSSYSALVLFKKVYLSKKIFKDLKSKNPKPKHIAVLEHEKKHLERMQKMGLFHFGIKYCFLPRFRFQEELLATKEAMKYLKKNKLKPDIKKKAKFLSSWVYWWMVSYDKAEKELKKLWQAV